MKSKKQGASDEKEGVRVGRIQTNRKTNQIGVLLVVLLLSILLTGNVFAESGPGTGGTSGKITIIEISQTNKKPIVGMELSLYQVADVSINGEYTLTETFSSLTCDLNALETSEDFKKASAEFTSYMKEKAPVALKTAKTDAQGKVVFSDLPDGMYFVGEATMEFGRYHASSDAFFIPIPSVDATSHQWIREVTAEPKAISKTDTSDDDDDDGSDRPGRDRPGKPSEGPNTPTSSNGPGSGTGEPTIPAEPQEPDVPVTTEDPPPKLPQTGFRVVKAVVPAVFGVILLLCGAYFLTDDKKNEN